MTMHANEGPDRSAGGLVRDLTQAISDLFRNELQLARNEMSGKVDQVFNGAVMIVGGLVAALAALLVLLLALVAALSNVMPPWVASVLVGVAVAIVAFLLVQSGQSQLRATNLAPQRTMDSLRTDARIVKERSP